MVNLRRNLAKIFTDAQICSGNLPQNVLKLMEITKKVDFELFLREMQFFTDALLISDEHVTNPYVERCQEFIGSFCYKLKRKYDDELNKNNDDHEHMFIEKYISNLLQRQNRANFIVRVRACQLINKILDQLVGTDIDAQLCDRIEEALFNRLSDAKLEVRLEAIKALHRFQDKSNPLDRIIDMFKFLMEEDRFSKVRCLCIQKIALREDVIPIILTRIRDTEVVVRHSAYERLLKIPGGLKIKQKRTILNCASLDESKKIETFIESVLLPAWFHYYNDSFHLFMKAVRLDGSEDDILETNYLCEFILNKSFQTIPLNQLIEAVNVDKNTKLIPLENLDWETSNYWRILIEFIREHPHYNDEIDCVLPELVHFCEYIKCFCKNLPKVESTTDYLQNQFILKQLFTITKGYDLSDPVARKTLQNVIHYALSNAVLIQDTVVVIIKNLERLIPNTNGRALFINELISEIRSPAEEIHQQGQITEKLRVLKFDRGKLSNDQERAMNERNYDLAQSLQTKLDEITKEITRFEMENNAEQNGEILKKCDKATIIKCLDIAAGLLLSPSIKKMCSALETMKREAIFQFLIHPDELIQSKAMQCYGLICIIDKNTAKDGIHLFSAPLFAYQCGQECSLQIILICIGTVVDLLRIFGNQLIASRDETKIGLSESQTEDQEGQFFGGTSLTKVINCLADLLEDEEIKIREHAGRGLCNLICDNIIQSPLILAKLLLKWADPYEISQKLKQIIIASTLQRLPNIKGFHEQWEKAIIATLKLIIYAPPDNSYSEIKPESIIKFMLALYEANSNDKSMLIFALRLCSEIREKPRARQVWMLSKALIMLKFPKDDPIVDDILSACDELQDLIENKLVLNNLAKLTTMLNQLRGVIPKRRRSSSSESEDDMEDE